MSKSTSKKPKPEMVSVPKAALCALGHGACHTEYDSSVYQERMTKFFALRMSRTGGYLEDLKQIKRAIVAQEKKK